ncbi:MAG: phosphopyruvate hydratase [Bacillota bacterium]
MDRIKAVRAREILNAKGKPTVEVELTTENGIVTAASSPSGTSTGADEAFELYDNDFRYQGFGVRKAVENVNKIIAPALVGKDVINQTEIDAIMKELDGTSNKRNLGGNAILAVSVAAAKAGAKSVGLPVYKYLAPGSTAFKMPGLVATVIAGGNFSASGLEFEDYMYVLKTESLFADTLEKLSSLRYKLGTLTNEKFGYVPVEGGSLAPPLTDSDSVFQFMLEAAEQLGYGREITLGVDVVAGNFYDKDTKKYNFGFGPLDEKETIEYYKKLCNKFPVTYWEDAFEENCFHSFANLKKELPYIQIVGDDLFVTSTSRLKKGIEAGSANGILVKINQAGTVSETLEACKLAKDNGMDLIISMRSGETADDFIADLAVALGAKQVKLGSPVVLERNIKYNRLLKIEQELITG